MPGENALALTTGAQLLISEKTVENHVRNIIGKLHLSRSAELIRWAADHNM
jgi:DNA-binding NarL/FixJ family response regulator